MGCFVQMFPDCRDSEMTLVTMSISLRSQFSIYLAGIKWAFHRMHFNWISSHSYPCFRKVVDYHCFHSLALDCAGDDSRTGHDPDLYGHEKDLKRDLKQSCDILSQSVYSVALSHGFLVTCLFSP